MMKEVRVPLLVLFLATSAVPILGQATTKIANSIGECRTHLGTPGSGEYDVEITFSGIAVFDRETDGMIKVRIPNLAKGRAPIKDSHGNKVREKISPHIAYILTDAQTAKPLMDAHQPLQPAFNESSCYFYYRLTDEIITVDPSSAPDTTNKNLCVIDPASDGNVCPSGATEGSMKWLPSLKQILGTAQTPDEPHFKNPDGTTIAAMVRVDRGFLETVANAKKVWAFLKKEGDTEKMKHGMAQEVRWHMRGTGAKFILKLQPLTGSPINLEFLPVGGKVSILIGNSPIDETGPIHKSMNMKEDPHFRAYYEFIKNFDVKSGPIPYKSATPCQTGSKSQTPVLKLCAGCPDPDPAECATQLAETGTLIANKDFKPKPKRSTAKAAKKSSHGRMTTRGNPLPSGLNCGSTQWP